MKRQIKYLDRFVGHGLMDPRLFNTFALGCAALRDCEKAGEYLEVSKTMAESIQFSPRYRKDLDLENQPAARMCELFVSYFEEKE